MQRLGNSVSLSRTLSLLLVASGFLLVAVPSQAQSFATQSSAAQSSAAIAALRPLPQSNRVPAHANLAPQARLTGHLPAWVAGENLSSRPVDLQSPMQVTLVLRRDPAVQAAFEALLTAQQDPASPLYHQWLTPQQLGTLYGPTQSDLDAVTAWASAQGLKIDSVAPNRMTVRLSGTTSAIANAFRTSFGYYTLAGKQRLAASTEPSVPAALAPVFLGIDGLVDLPIEPQSHYTVGKLPSAGTQGGSLASASHPDPLLTITSGGVAYHFLVPADLATIYDITPVYTAGNTGATIGTKTQHIAVIGRSNVAATDISYFASNTGIASYHLNEIVAAGLDPGTTGTGDQSEATLDVDRTISTANGAYTDLVVAANAYGGIYAAASYNVNTLLDPVMTISFGACESAAGSTNTLLWDSLFSAGAAEGISSFVSSGDSAAAGCATAGSSAPSVTPVASINYICSSSYVTCVGGTEFNDTASPSTYWASTNNSTTLGSALSYIPEGVWNEPLGSTANTYVILGGGGGFSQYIAKPTWQTGTGVPADGHRDVPDVSFSAAGHDGYFSCLAFAGGTCATGYFVAFSGTSASAPEMAGIAALVNTRAGVAQGNFNPLIYRLATSVPAVFHDATVTSSGVSGCTLLSASICNNSTPGPSGLTGGLAGYALGTGYDQATGWGSLDVNLFVAAAPGFNLTAATPSISFTSGATTGNTDTVTLTSYNTFAGAVSLTCSIAGTTAPFPPSCVVAPTSITLTAKSTGTAVVTIGSTVAQASLDPASRPRFPGRDLGAGGAVLAAMLLGFLPNRRRARRILASLTLALLLAIGLGSIGGCSSSSGNGSPTLRSSAGSYTVTVTATSGTLTANTTFTVTIN